MADQLSKALEDQATAEDEMRAEQDCTGDFAKELASLQGQRRNTEKLWVDEVSRLRGQLLVQ